MTTQLTGLVPRRQIAPPIRVLAGVDLARARLHEVCGPARRSFALIVARALTGPVIWIHPAWATDQPHAPGMAGMIDPGRLLMVAPQRPDDLLWTMEEALRSGAAPLVLADLPEPPGLTPVRRLHLAAEAGAEAGPQRPTGLILTPGDGGAAGVESRWHVTARHDPRGHRWLLEQRRARGRPVGACHVQPAPDGGWQPAPTATPDAQPAQTTES